MEKSILIFWGHFWGRGVVKKNCCQLFLEAPPIKVSVNRSNFTVSPKKKNLHAFMTLCPLQYLFVPQCDHGTSVSGEFDQKTKVGQSTWTLELGHWTLNQCV